MEVGLASTCPLPQAVADSSERHIMKDNDSTRVLRTERLKGAPTLAVAPYQATPVCGAITHHHATGLEISDDKRSEEVRPGPVSTLAGGRPSFLVVPRSDRAPRPAGPHGRDQ